ncbi:hypothetical protein EDB89DRAFT_1904495 [Lactarius sanguifluus]|nr:hypothetical protein EDB89DRAFT_1904495 [Lactarius sanguifluus]
MVGSVGKIILFHTFFYMPGELLMAHGDDANNSLGHLTDRIHLATPTPTDTGKCTAHHDDDPDPHAVQLAAINCCRRPANAGCQWSHPLNTMVMAAAVAMADHD